MESKLIIDIDIPLDQLMKHLGCNPDLIGQAIMSNLACSYQADGVKIFTVESPNIIGQVAPIKLGVLQSLISGKLSNGSAAKDLARIGLEKAVKHVLNAIGPFEKAILAEAKKAEIGNVVETLKDIFTPPNGVKKIEEAFAKVAPPTGSKVKLKDATALFQPVSGTDETSKYYCIALRDDLKVAARIKSAGKISIRVEGSGIQKYKSNLLAAGLSDSGTYCSVHLSADSNELARKCVGSVIYGTGIQFQQIATDLQPIWGYGS
ncbi:unnamed protein product [Sphagnum balticum]